MGGGALSTTGSALGYGAAIGAPTAAGLAGNEAETVNEQGAIRAARGEEATTGRLTREIREAHRQQQTLKGKIDGLQERITREQGIVDRLTAQHGDKDASPVAATVKDARARIERLTAEREALAARLRPAGPRPPVAGTVTTPEPPRRPEEFGGSRRPWVDPRGSAEETARGAARATPPVPAVPGAGALQPPVTTPAATPTMDAGAVTEATAALQRYRTELAGIERQLAGLRASGEAAFSPDLSGLETRKGEVEQLITGLETRLRALGAETIAPKVNAQEIDALKQKSGEARDKLSEINGLTISPKADVSGLRQITSEANTAAAALLRVIALAGQANASIARVNAAAPGGGSTGRVRQALSDNFA